MSTDERLSNLEKLSEHLEKAETGTCPLCFRPEGMPEHADKIDIVQDLVRHSFLCPINFEQCTKKSHEITKVYEEELGDVIHFIWQSLQLIKSDLHWNTGFGFVVADVDINRPAELIRLFADFDIMEFVLKRFYDTKTESNQFGGWFVVFDGKVWNGHQVIESGRYLHDKGKFMMAYRNANNIFKSIDKDWLNSLDPDQYDWYKTPVEAKKRHFDFIADNIEKNMQFVIKNREKYKKWLDGAEAELGRKLVYKSYGA